MSPRAAVTVFFALDGFAPASFSARLPAIQDRLDLSTGRIGLALLALTAALVISQPLAGGARLAPWQLPARRRERAACERRDRGSRSRRGEPGVGAPHEGARGPRRNRLLRDVLLAVGAIADWSAIHLADTLAASDATAVAAGIVVAATAPSVPVAVAGFAFTGIGLSALFALMVRAASDRAGDAPGPAIAVVSTAGYGGLVTGPPLVGFLAEVTSLRLALGAVLGLLCLTAAALASYAR